MKGLENIQEENTVGRVIWNENIVVVTPDDPPALNAQSPGPLFVGKAASENTAFAEYTPLHLPPAWHLRG